MALQYSYRSWASLPTHSWLCAAGYCCCPCTDDLVAGTKLEYDSVIGLLALFERAGGAVNCSMCVIAGRDDDTMRHPLIAALHQHFTAHADVDDRTACSRSAFAAAFLTRSLTALVAATCGGGSGGSGSGSGSCDAADKDCDELLTAALALFDLDGVDSVQWCALEYRAAWVLSQCRGELVSVDAVMAAIIDRVVLPLLLTDDGPMLALDTPITLSDAVVAVDTVAHVVAAEAVKRAHMLKILTYEAGRGESRMLQGMCVVRAFV